MQLSRELSNTSEMKLNRYDKVMTFLCVILLVVDIGVLWQNHRQKTPVEPTEIKVDTLVIRDTIMQYKPIFVDKIKVDSVLIPIKDTIVIRDSVYIYMDREKITWRDSLCEVYASGIMASVDSVRHFQEYKYITFETQVPVKVRSHWGLGVNAGYGVGKGGLTPYVGVGISYNLLSW